MPKTVFHNQKRTPSKKNPSKGTKDAEDLGRELPGFAPFFFSTIFSLLSKLPGSKKKSAQSHFQSFFSGLLLLQKRRNLLQISSGLPAVAYKTLHRFITGDKWPQQQLCSAILHKANENLGGNKHSCLIIDPSCFPKKGDHSVGVQRQWCGTLGKVDNCQKGVFASLACGTWSCLIAKQLYLPKIWCEDAERCDKARIPEECRAYRSASKIALDLIAEIDAEGLNYKWILMDAEFGKSPAFFHQLDGQGKTFLIDVCHTQKVALRRKQYPAGRPKSGSFKGKLRFVPKETRTVAEIAKSLPDKKWRPMEVRETTCYEFAQVKIWYGKGTKGMPPKAWCLLLRRDRDKNGEWKYKYAITNQESPRPKDSAYRMGQRLWIEGNFRENKDGLGMDEYQVRRWQAWHNQMALSLLCALVVLLLRWKQQEKHPLLSVWDVQKVLMHLLRKEYPETEKSLAREIIQSHKSREMSQNALKEKTRKQIVKRE